ncbi:MAG: septation regulator SpoVG [bacterium]
MNGLVITDVKVRPFKKDDDKLKAFATITFNNCFVVCDLKVIQGNDALFVAMPSRKRNDGTFRDVAHPLNQEMRDIIEEQVISVYHEELKSLGGEQETSPVAASAPALAPAPTPSPRHSGNEDLGEEISL